MPSFSCNQMPPMGDPTGMMQTTGFGPGMGPTPGFGPGFGPGPGPVTTGPVNIAPANVTPPIVSPTQHFVNTNQFTTIVPHIHPSHTTTVNKHKFIHEHYCPHTESCVNEVSHQHVNCGCPRPMKPFCGC
ncbi:CotD family spore coat protein [Pallidibacillus thermolactis]|jgi:spore coat protein D|uniref:CotD family spore coat protein n=1 Tax=Pallidibacillus thermolactis TaxID=251051 RepID=UPI0035EB33BD